jgi:transcriptional regulator with XRE-family HTH domain
MSVGAKLRHNSIGRNVTKFRSQRGWTRRELTVKLQSLGCKITPDNLAEIETQNCAVTDAQIAFLTQVFNISVRELFPHEPGANGVTSILRITG